MWFKRGWTMHRLVILWLMREVGKGDEELDPAFHVHHQDFDKWHNCPCNLVYMDNRFNPTGAQRCPVTGQYLSANEYVRRYGDGLSESENGMPDWVVN